MAYLSSFMVFILLWTFWMNLACAISLMLGLRNQHCIARAAPDSLQLHPLPHLEVSLLCTPACSFDLHLTL